MQASNNKQEKKKEDSNAKRPFTKGDFETVLKAATKPLKKEQGEPKSAGT